MSNKKKLKPFSNVESSKKGEYTDDLEGREFVREELTWLANFIMAKYNLSVNETRHFLHELLLVSI